MTKNKNDFAAKRMARLASVQGLYQIALTNCTPKDVITHFRENPLAFLNETEIGTMSPNVDYTMFTDVVTGVTDNQESIDDMIVGAFDSRQSGERIEALLRAILRAGVFELHHHTSVPTGVIINDYVDVTHIFFDAKEPALVNGILNTIAKTLRAV